MQQVKVNGYNVVRAVFFALVLACACLAAPACLRSSSPLLSPTLTEVHARASLDVLREVIDPAYALAVQGCKDRQGALVADAEEGGITVKQAELQLAAIRARCSKVVALFDELRTYHEEGARFVEDGRIEDAEQEITKAREAWRSLAERVESP